MVCLLWVVSWVEGVERLLLLLLLPLLLLLCHELASKAARHLFRNPLETADRKSVV